VSDVYPARIPDVFSSKPIVITGRYANAGKATIRVRGRQAGRDVEREIALDLPEREPDHDVIATLWARRKIDAVMSQDWAGAQTGAPRVDVREGVTKLGLDFGLMTQYTSFVAVEEMVVNEGGQQRHVEVPVEVPEGVSYEGVFGGEADKNQMAVGGAGRARPMMKTSRIGGYVAAPKPVAQPTSTVATEEKDVDEVSVDAPPPPPHIAKLDPALVAVVERVKKHAAAGPDEGAFVADGKAELQVWLTDTSEATIEKLRKLGFEVVLAPKSAKMVVGRISVDKLEALAKLAEVRYVTPNRS
jgi:Ca-activated chloride channel family protein